MPYQTVEVPAEVLLEYLHFKVYYTYDHGEIENPLAYWYQFEEDSDVSFDVRDLPNFGAVVGSNEYRKNIELYSSREYHADVIREALSHGHLDDVLRREEIATVPEITWPEDHLHLMRWQLIDLIKSYDTYFDLWKDDGPIPGTIKDYYQRIYRPNQIKDGILLANQLKNGEVNTK
jgi:hypothetical protein